MTQEILTDLSDLVNLLNEWEKIQDGAQEVTGSRAQLIDPKGRFIAGKQYLPKFCSLIQGSKIGQRRCQDSYSRCCFAKERLEEGFSLFTCHAGLLNFAIPLTLQNGPIGSVLLGGVLEEGVIQEKCRRYAHEIGLDGDALLMSMQLIRTLSRDHFLTAGKMFRPLIRPFLDTIYRYHHLQESADHFIKIIEKKDGLLMIDDLTHLPNERYLLSRLDGEMYRARRYIRPLSLMVIELDTLEEVNKIHGHLAGDHLIKEMAELLKRHIRRSEILVRKSGDKFAIILPEKEETLSYDLAERLREVVAKFTFCKALGLALTSTITTGVASLSTETTSPKILIERAVYALNRARKRGRNRTLSFMQAIDEEEPKKNRVVITGIGVITPLGMDKESFWTGICQGRSGVSRIESFDTSDLPARIAGEIKDFDPLKYMDAKKARRIGRASQFAIAATRMALEDAGLDISKETPERVGVIIGSGVGGLTFAEDQVAKFIQQGPERVSPYLSINIFGGALSSEISLEFGLKGPSITISTGCPAGTDAIGYACKAIQRGEVEVIITGGTEAPIRPVTMTSFIVMRALSTRNEPPEEVSRPFDLKRDGFVLSEGGCILILEELDHALRRGAHIYGEVAGYGATVDAHHMTAPDPEGRQTVRAVRLAIKDAGLKPEEIDYLNAHGSSTPLGDKAETRVFKEVFGEYAYGLPISSTKSMLGHSIGATGAVEAAVCTLAIERGILPPTINYEYDDPDCDLDYIPNQFLKREIDVALSDSIGFGGKNSALIIKRYKN